MYIADFHTGLCYARGSVIFKGSADGFSDIKYRMRAHTYPKLSQNHLELQGTGFVQVELVGSSVLCGDGEAGSCEVQ